MKMQILTAIAAASLTAGCAHHTEEPTYQEAVPPLLELSETSTISGMLTYRERIALPPGSIATVSLLDVARADAPSRTVDEVRYDLNGVSVPFAFELTKPNRNQPAGVSYTVRAVIRSADDRLLWTTDTINPVMSRPVDQDLGTLVMVAAR